MAKNTRDQWEYFAPFNTDPDIAKPRVMTSFLVTAWVTSFVACIQLYCLMSSRFRLKLLSSVSGTTAEHVGKYTVKLTRVYISSSVERRFPRFIRGIQISLYAVRCLLAIFLSLFRDAQPRLQLFSQMALDRLCDLQLVTGTTIIIAGIAEFHHMSFYHQSLITSYWLLTLNAFWAARAGYLNSEHYGRGRSFYFWTRWVFILISDLLSIYYQIVTTLDAANHWDSEESGHCYLSHEPSPTNSQYFWIVGISFEVVYMLFYFMQQVAQSLSNKWQWLKGFLDFIANTSNNLSNESQQRALKFWTVVEFHTNHWPIALRVILHALRKIFYMVWHVFWQILALWAWGDNGSVLIVIGYIGLAAWNTFDVIDSKLSNQSFVIGDESTWGFGQILPLGLLALICLDLLDILNKAYKHQSTIITSDSWVQKDELSLVSLGNENSVWPDVRTYTCPH
ncbi:hypothetical protein sscle_16g107350 [Sclerotinia sclerotiorum 1980 UF-70]|uniref:Uncharacterized protein n=2 Tax=Sclerotinia sclerotiorum (strain ATCC 18683 / 1980 / Ss-1) TaxID=665079 RepID=A0A1D9QM04_SCLS1|nr:hypothetical protein sscle_16g107350 [Sclerotinia sclerotiorum 1980 UF-70]